MASTSGVAEAATRSLLMSIRRILIHCGSMYVNLSVLMNAGTAPTDDAAMELPERPRLLIDRSLPSLPAYEDSGRKRHSPVGARSWKGRLVRSFGVPTAVLVRPGHEIPTDGYSAIGLRLRAKRMDDFGHYASHE